MTKSLKIFIILIIILNIVIIIWNIKISFYGSGTQLSDELESNAVIESRFFYDIELVGCEDYERPIAVYTDGSTGISFVYPVNKNGQSYGWAPLGSPNITTADYEYCQERGLGDVKGLLPDLVGMFVAFGTEDVQGYIRKEDYLAFEPSSPEEALRLQDEAAFDRVVSLYSSDGEEVIGEFVFGDSVIALSKR